MQAGVARGRRDDLSRFRRLLDITIVATLGLVVIGGVVRVSDSGLGCGPAGSGAHGWPLCEGQVLPFLEGSTLVEFSHRVVAGLVAVLIALLVLSAWRRLRERTWVVRGTVAAAVLVLVQAGLGGLTVEHNLEEALVAAHLGLAMLLLAALLAVRRASEDRTEPLGGATRGLRRLALLASLLLLATIVAGGYVAGTEKEGVAGAHTVQGAHMACGDRFPGCAEGFMPFGASSLVDIHLTHRAFMYLTAIAVLALVLLARRRGIRSRAYPLAAALLVAQIALGAVNVWAGEHAGLVVAHLTLGTLLWSTVVFAGLQLVAVPAAGRARVGRAAPEEAAVTA